MSEWDVDIEDPAEAEEDSEPARLRDEIAGRPEAVVLVTRIAAESAALRDWGLLAVARPESGGWCRSALEAVHGRDVVFVTAETRGRIEWMDSDVSTIAALVPRLGTLTPKGCFVQNPPRDLVEFVNDQRASGTGPQEVAQEAKRSLIEVSALHAQAGKRERGRDWPALRYGRRPPSEPFPVEVFPEPVAQFVRAVADAVGAPCDFAGLAALVTAGAAIGRSVALQLKPGYCVSPALFGLNVGGPSSGKSPSLAAVLQPLRAIDAMLHRQYHEEQDRHAREAEEAKAAGREPPPKPVLHSALLEDFVVETLAPHLVCNPRGLLVACDEGAAWVASLGRGPSAERRLWFSALRGLPLRIDRKRSGDAQPPMRLDAPFLAFCGNVSSEVLQSSGARAEGLLERVLFAFPDEAPFAHWSERGLPDELKVGWADAIERLRGPLPHGSGAPAKRLIELAADALAEWVPWHDDQADALNLPGADAVARGAEGKLRDFGARLALILHGLDVACHPTRGPGEPPPPVSRSAVLRAIRLCTYFRVQQRRVRWAVDNGDGHGVARAIVNWIQRMGKEQFSVSELKYALRWLSDRPGQPEASLRWLEDQSAIMRREQPNGGAPKRGRPRSAVYDVHPALSGLCTLNPVFES